MSTANDTDTKDSRYYRHCRAKSGYGPRRKALIDELRSEENMLTHYIILGMGAGENPSDMQMATEARKETEAKIAALKQELDDIVGPWRDPGDKV